MLRKLQKETLKELKENILPFWEEQTIDKENGGFYGYINNDMDINFEADKSVVICSRILWTFSKAYNFFNEKKYFDVAKWAYDFLIKHFYDFENGGVFWKTNFKGNVVSTKKQVYAQAFFLYGLSEYYMACKDENVKDLCKKTFIIIENFCRDKCFGGYFEAFQADWSPIEDASLSEKDLNVPKSMNTNLHVMEAYANFYKINKSYEVKNALKEIVIICSEKIINKDKGHFNLFFDEKWNSMADIVSYGHDIEGSWLLVKASLLLDDEVFHKDILNIVLKMAETSYSEGLDKTTGLLHERVVDGVVQGVGTEWWTYAEAVVGFLNAYELTKEKKYYEAVLLIWNYIKNFLVDNVNGEWFLSANNSHDRAVYGVKVSEWKCPYHNSRMCFEVMDRVDNLLNRDKEESNHE